MLVSLLIIIYRLISSPRRVAEAGVPAGKSGAAGGGYSDVQSVPPP